MTLLVQKEVAEKICTLEPDMTVLSLQVALFGTAKLIKKVQAGNFYPIPKVDSAIIHIDLLQKENSNFTEYKDAIKILQIAKVCFSNRRKKLKNTLPKEYQAKALAKNLDLGRRPETLSVNEWKSLVF